ncbi:MAG: SpoIIE family protein phosphatase [Tissierellia bacterium]|nr:SpoIIE family protein phosphatase [Tissierellia bacterium]
MTSLFADIGFRSLNKHGEQICGDHVQVHTLPDNSPVVVLADGLGSGIKANILSTLTSQIMATMLANNLPLEVCLETMVKTLPICEVRGIAYSTFSVIRLLQNEEAEILQYDNPHVILLRNGRHVEFPKQKLEIDGKTVFKSKLYIHENDIFIMLSDGAIHAGIGNELNYGWQRENIIRFVEDVYIPEFTAKTIATMVSDQCDKLYGHKPGDDTTVCVIRMRKRKAANVIIGPPSDPSSDDRLMEDYLSTSGKRVICGGTTAKIAARYLKKDIVSDCHYLDPEIPPTASIEGIDLVTEGILTVNRCLVYAKNYLEDNTHYATWAYKKDGASRLSRVLFEEATDINFFVGKAVNPAHQNPDLPIDFSIKMRLVEQLSESLGEMGKQITIRYY